MNRKIILFSVKSVLYSWSKYLLAASGIIIAIVAQIVSSSLCTSYNQAIQKQMLQTGASIISIELRSNDREEAVKGLCDNCAAVDDAIQYVQTTHSIQTTSGKQDTTLIFTQNSYFSLSNVVLDSGEAILSDTHSTKNTVVVNEYLAENCLPNLSIGAEIYIGNIPFAVVGVINDGRFGEQSVCYINVCYLTKFKKDMTPGTSWLLPLKIESFDQINEAEKEVEAYLLNRYHERVLTLKNSASEDADISKLIKNVYTVSSIEDQYRGTRETVEIVETISVAFFVLLLLVGVLSIFNLFRLLFMERHIEFGVSKAVGATRDILLTQMLIETAIVGGCSIIVGFLVGVGAAFLLGAILRLQILIVWEWVAISSLVVFFSTITAGVIPAYTAANTDPTVTINQ